MTPYRKGKSAEALHFAYGFVSVVQHKYVNFDN